MCVCVSLFGDSSVRVLRRVCVSGDSAVRVLRRVCLCHSLATLLCES